MFNPELSVKPFIVAFNKMDLPEASEKWPSFRKSLQAHGIEPFCMSAVTTEGTQEVITSAYKLVQQHKANEEQGQKLNSFLFPLDNLTHCTSNCICSCLCGCAA